MNEWGAVNQIHHTQPPQSFNVHTCIQVIQRATFITLKGREYSVYVNKATHTVATCIPVLQSLSGLHFLWSLRCW